MSSKMKSYGWLLSFAWGYEILAAVTGIAIAMSFNADMYEQYISGELGAGGLALLATGTLPFIMVAAAELCKIPLIAAVMISRKLYLENCILVRHIMCCPYNL